MSNCGGGDQTQGVVTLRATLWGEVQFCSSKQTDNSIPVYLKKCITFYLSG